MATGKLYGDYGEEMLATVDYRLYDGSRVGWWGELLTTEFTRLKEGDGFVIELSDRRRGHCLLRKRVNRAVSGVPPRYIYRFTGVGPLE